MKIFNASLLKNFGKNDKVNVAIISDIFYPHAGGATVVADNMARELMKIANVVVIAPNGKGEINVPYPLIRVKAVDFPAFGCLAFPKFDLKLKKLVKSLNINIFHGHTVFSLVTYFQRFAKKNNIPFVLSGHSKFPDEYKTLIKSGLIRKYLVNRAARVLNNCTEIWPVAQSCEKVYREMGVKTECKVFRNATELVLPQNKEELIENAKQRLKFAGGGWLFIVFYVATQYPNKKYKLCDRSRCGT